jgi:hypothetical protein
MLCRGTLRSQERICGIEGIVEETLSPVRRSRDFSGPFRVGGKGESGAKKVKKGKMDEIARSKDHGEKEEDKHEREDIPKERDLMLRSNNYLTTCSLRLRSSESSQPASSPALRDSSMHMLRVVC